VRTFLVTSGLGALLIQQGALVLNATTLVRDGKAVLLLGSPATGKSTLAWCLFQQGWHLLSSELSVVDSKGLVWPGIQQLKLWHDTAVALDLDWQNLPLVRRGLKRYALGPAELPVAGNPTPLVFIYGLGRRKPTNQKSEKEKPKEDPISNVEDATNSSEQQLFRAWARKSDRESLLTLRNQAYQPRFYRAMEQEASLFLQASHLLKRVPVHSLNVPDGITKMRNASEGMDLFNPDSLFSQEETLAAVEIEA
jgi:energy-coupling factor transporter ATP-binding protein EcfA2